MACSSYLSRYGSQHSRYTVFWPLFSWNCTVCPRSVLIQLWNCIKACFFEPRIWGLIVKEVHSCSKSWIVATSNLPEKHTCSFFFSLQQELWLWFWIFWNKMDVSDFLVGSHLTVLLHLIRVTISMAVSPHKTLPSDHFSQGMVWCFLGLSLQNS